MIANAGGNTAVFIMANGVTLVDTKNPEHGSGDSGPGSHGDSKADHHDHQHAHPCRPHRQQRILHGQRHVCRAREHEDEYGEDDQLRGDKAKFLPSRVYKDTLTLGTGADQIVLYYFGRAHTSGDTFVVFPALRVMHTGDAFATKGFPNVDVNNGGSVVEYGKTLAKAASTIKNVDTIINGHITTGPTQFSDLQVYADFNKDFLAYVQDAIKANKTADQAAAEYKFPEKYAALGYTLPPPGGRGGPANNIRSAYTELGK